MVMTGYFHFTVGRVCIIQIRKQRIFIVPIGVVCRWKFNCVDCRPAMCLFNLANSKQKIHHRYINGVCITFVNKELMEVFNCFESIRNIALVFPVCVYVQYLQDYLIELYDIYVRFKVTKNNIVLCGIRTMRVEKKKSTTSI